MNYEVFNMALNIVISRQSQATVDSASELHQECLDSLLALHDKAVLARSHPVSP